MDKKKESKKKLKESSKNMAQSFCKRPDHILHIKILQATPIKKLIENYKDLLSDCNFEIDHNRIRLFSLNKTEVIGVYLKLDADKFAEYYCKSPTSIGMDIMNFHKLISVVGNHSVMTFDFFKSTRDFLNITVQNQNSVLYLKLQLRDLDDERMDFPPMNYPCSFVIDSSYFQRICRHMDNIGDVLEIKCVDRQIQFSTQGRIGTARLIIPHKKISYKKDDTRTIIQGIFPLDKLCVLAKFANLSNNVTVYLQNDEMMILEYAVANLGITRLCLAQFRPEEESEEEFG